MSEATLPMTFYGLDRDKKFLEALQYMTKLDAFAGDLLITFGRRLSFLRDDKEFAKSLFSHPEKQALTLAWRLHTACWAAKNACKLDGDFVECGVLNGITSSMIISYLRFGEINKNYYLYDTFSGIPDGYINGNEHLNHDEYKMPGMYKKLCERFSKFPNVKIIKGELPSKLEEICPEKICFLHMDLANFPSERDTLAKLINRIVEGGIVLFQGFGIKYYDIWKIAKEDYIEKRNLSILELPTGQGMMIVR